MLNLMNYMMSEEVVLIWHVDYFFSLKEYEPMFMYAALHAQWLKNIQIQG